MARKKGSEGTKEVYAATEVDSTVTLRASRGGVAMSEQVDLRDLPMSLKIELCQWAVRERLLRAARSGGMARARKQAAAFREGRLQVQGKEKARDSLACAVAHFMDWDYERAYESVKDLGRTRRNELRRDPAIRKALAEMQEQEPGSIAKRVLGMNEEQSDEQDDARADAGT